jgi:uncharacterized protein
MIKKHPLISFFLITFLITWGIAGLFFLFPEGLVTLTRKEADAYHPLFRVAASAPTLAAFLVILVTQGKQGLLDFLARYLEFVRLRWYVIVFGGIVTFGFALRFIEQSLGMSVPNLPFTWISFLPFAMYWPLYDPGPLGEEGGWRGFALPLLQLRFSPFLSAVILGVIWSVWHLPAFYISTLNQSGLIFPLFLLSNVALVMFMISVYNVTQGNIAMMIVIHWAYNLIGVFAPMDSYFFTVNTLLFSVAAVSLHLSANKIK